MSEEAADAYAGVRERVIGLVRAADDDALLHTVPACPEWTVKDVLAHLTGVCADIRDGRLDGVATDPWTAKQVADRRERTVPEIIEEWEGLAPVAHETTTTLPAPFDAQLVFDAVTHEHDIRGALEEPGATDSDAVQVASQFLFPALTNGWGPDRPALRVRVADGEEWVFGRGDPAVTLTASRFDLIRAFSGRRSLDQIRALGWDGDPDVFIGWLVGGPFRPASRPLAH